MDYKDTLNLPVTDFPMKASLAQTEPEILAQWEQMGIYQLIRTARAGCSRYTLHDGPPYANGSIHLGTALNKILKDIVVRAQTMEGRDAPYVPGWDCHGLPIEHRVTQELRKQGKTAGRMELREKCAETALHFMGVQRQQFQRLGVLGDWENPYLTLKPAYEAHELEVFAEMVGLGLVTRALKPVYWCPSYETALAEAEVEYYDITSPSIYVKFPSIDVATVAGAPDLGGLPLSVLIWTTTPWTLPANLAICLSPEVDYAFARFGDEVMVMAEYLIPRVAKEAGLGDWELLGKVPGKLFEYKKCKHPFIDRESLLILGPHVNLEQGCGCVHTAPGHGLEDYLIGLQYNLPVYSPVDSRGCFTSEFPECAGKFVEKANADIIAMMEARGVLVHQADYLHSYPHDWREKKPIIFRATPQWFVSLEHSNLRGRLLEAIDQVEWVPQWGRERINGMLSNRVEWCISRQRAWGVPIPAVYDSATGEAMLTRELVMAVAEVFREHGSAVWFAAIDGQTTPAVDQLWAAIRRATNSSPERPLRLETDTLDVWFDSGASHRAVLNNEYGLSWPADLYLEGSDQHRGWFQSSLTTAIAVQGQPPYRTVLTHGFFVDEDRRKMSKSLGNVIEPEQVISQYGADVLRIWVASEDFRNDIPVSHNILKQRAEAYRKIRNTWRYLLGALNDFKPEQAVEDRQLLMMDRWVLDKLNRLSRHVRQAYREFEFHRAFHRMHEFCVLDLSAHYLDILKDRLYTFPTEGTARRAAQTVLYRVLVETVKLMNPILVFTCEEVWQNLRKAGLVSEASVNLAEWEELGETRLNQEQTGDLEFLQQVREAVVAALEPYRKDKRIGQSLAAKIQLTCADELGYARLRRALQAPAGDDLEAWLVASQVQLCNQLEGEDVVHPESMPTLAIRILPADGEKCPRCWIYVQPGQWRKICRDHSEICPYRDLK